MSRGDGAESGGEAVKEKMLLQILEQLNDRISALEDKDEFVVKPSGKDTNLLIQQLKLRAVKP